ncbi:hypothetical protein VNO77_18964 [Canavalia gladiata]|uniref:Uncharacterized protein n=1 Tax=Canavalia gladiata TaxID=3824 RepID=A0AAN9QK37_CANGL
MTGYRRLQQMVTAWINLKGSMSLSFILLRAVNWPIGDLSCMLINRTPARINHAQTLLTIQPKMTLISVFMEQGRRALFLSERSYNHWVKSHSYFLELLAKIGRHSYCLEAATAVTKPNQKPRESSPIFCKSVFPCSSESMSLLHVRDLLPVWYFDIAISDHPEWCLATRRIPVSSIELFRRSLFTVRSWSARKTETAIRSTPTNTPLRDMKVRCLATRRIPVSSIELFRRSLFTVSSRIGQSFLYLVKTEEILQESWISKILKQNMVLGFHKEKNLFNSHKTCRDQQESNIIYIRISGDHNHIGKLEMLVGVRLLVPFVQVKSNCQLGKIRLIPILPEPEKFS